jgi:hypothetical protein
MSRSDTMRMMPEIDDPLPYPPTPDIDEPLEPLPPFHEDEDEEEEEENENEEDDEEEELDRIIQKEIDRIV